MMGASTPQKIMEVDQKKGWWVINLKTNGVSHHLEEDKRGG